jgi:hypothetical protein
MKSIYLFLEELWTNSHNDASCESGKVFCQDLNHFEFKNFFSFLKNYIILLKIK